MFSLFSIPRIDWVDLGDDLQDADGNLAPGAIANLVDELGGAVITSQGVPAKVSVDMSISYMSAAKVDVSVFFSSLFTISLT